MECERPEYDHYGQSYGHLNSYRASMLGFRLALLAVGMSGVSLLSMQNSAGLASAKKIDRELTKLNELPDPIRERAIRDFARQIRQQPAEYAVALATNLAIDGNEGSSPETLQEIAATLAEALRRLPPAAHTNETGFESLAELVRYEHTRVTLADPRFDAAMKRLEANDIRRSTSDFTLTDLNGREWNLKGLRGKVVLLDFWATWCPPCRREIPDLESAYERFKSQDLIVLAISSEESSTVRRFLSQNKISYPILLDRGDATKEQFLVRGIPQNFVFDRNGNLVAESLARPNMSGLLKMLKKAGLD